MRLKYDLCYNISSMIADIHITEKSFGDKTLMKNVKFSVDDGEKVGVVGRNGVGKSTLFGILSGKDTDYTGEALRLRLPLRSITVWASKRLWRTFLADFQNIPS